MQLGSLLCCTPSLLRTATAHCGTVCDIGNAMLVCRQWNNHLCYASSRRLWKFCVRSTGIPRRSRGQCWCYLTQANAAKRVSSSSGGSYTTYVRQGMASPFTKNIMLDVHRAFARLVHEQQRLLLVHEGQLLGVAVAGSVELAPRRQRREGGHCDEREHCQ